MTFMQGNGGHARGEAVIVSEELRLVFTGDIAVNITGFAGTGKVQRSGAVSDDQREYELATGCGGEDFGGTSVHRKYLYCCGHGAVLENVKNRGRGI